MSVHWGREALGCAFKERRWEGGKFFHLIFMLCGGVEMSFSLPVKRRWPPARAGEFVRNWKCLSQSRMGGWVGGGGGARGCFKHTNQTANTSFHVNAKYKLFANLHAHTQNWSQPEILISCVNNGGVLLEPRLRIKAQDFWNRSAQSRLCARYKRVIRQKEKKQREWLPSMIKSKHTRGAANRRIELRSLGDVRSH